jgi:hypothetical protein
MTAAYLNTMPTHKRDSGASKANMVKDISSQDNFIQTKRAFQTFKSQRLNRTYSDLKRNPQFALIGDFFF